MSLALVERDQLLALYRRVAALEAGGAHVAQSSNGGGTGGGVLDPGAPVSAPYVTTAANDVLTAEAPLGTHVIMQDILANRPAAGINGRLFYVTDSGEERWQRDNGTTWVDRGVDWDFVLNKPDLATQVELDAALALKANLASPTFTGDPLAPTPATGDNDTSIATTAFVKAQAYAPLASPVFTGNPTAPTPATSDNDTSVATTAMVQAAIDADVATHVAAADPHTGYVLESLVDVKGDLIAATAADTVARLAAGTNGHVLKANSATSTGLEWAVETGGIPPTIFDAKGDLIVATAADTAARKAVGANGTWLKADSTQGDGLLWATIADADIPAAIARLASPVFTGNPTAPTPATSDNDTSIATTAMVQAAVDADVATHVAAADPHTGYVLESLVDVKGDLIAATAADTVGRLAAGTNGHVLKANSATGTGLEWVAETAGGIPATIVDVKGDLIVATAADTVARKAVGTNGMWLKADSTQGDGLLWAVIADADVPAAIARLASPVFTGNPTAPTPATSDNDTSVATTAMVQAAIDADVLVHTSDATAAHAASAISYVGGTGMSAVDVEAAIDELATEKANSADIVSATIVDAKGDLIVATAADTIARKAVGTNGMWLKADSSTGDGLVWAVIADADVPATIARLASPVFTGNPTAPTPATSDNDTSVATTAMVQAAVDADVATHVAAGDPHPLYLLETLADAKGDILAATGGDTITRLAAGSNYQVLSSSSGTSTGLKWRSPDMLNVKDYGAVGDCVTDGSGNVTSGTVDTTAFQNALVDANVIGGKVFVPAGKYRIQGTLDLEGATLVGAGGVPRDGSAEVTTLVHDFNGNLINFPSTASGANGGGVQDMLLMNTATKTGTAVIHTAGAVGVGASRVFLTNVYISSFSTTGWTRDIDANGSAATLGCRQWFLTNVQCFGATTTDETIRLNKAVAFFCTNVNVYQAPAAVTAGVKVLGTTSTAVHWTGQIGGNFYTEANPTNQAGVVFFGSVEGNVTCAAGSARNNFVGYVGGTFTNSGDPSNYRIGSYTGGGVALDAGATGLVKVPYTFEALIVRMAGATNGAVFYDRDGAGSNTVLTRDIGGFDLFDSATATVQLRFESGSSIRSWIEIPKTGSPMRIGHTADKNGFMSVGLQHDGTNDLRDVSTDDTPKLYLQSGTTSYLQCYHWIHGTGMTNFWSAQTDDASRFIVNGNGCAAAWNVSSDERLKKNVKDIGKEIGSALDKVKSLRPVAYSWKRGALESGLSRGKPKPGVHARDGYTSSEDKGGTTPRHFGFIAQEIEKILPDVVSRDSGDPDAFRSLDYNRIVPVLVAALQEETAARHALEARIKQLETR